MKRGIALSVITVFFAATLAACGGGGGGGAEAPSSPPQSYTVMVYMLGSDLESNNFAASADIAEMLSAPTADNVNIVLTTGGANVVSRTDWRTVKRHIINRTNPTGTELADLGSLDMANPTTLQNFVTWAQTAYPADHFILVLWDHGGGSQRIRQRRNAWQFCHVD